MNGEYCFMIEEELPKKNFFFDLFTDLEVFLLFF